MATGFLSSRLMIAERPIGTGHVVTSCGVAALLLAAGGLKLHSLAVANEALNLLMVGAVGLCCFQILLALALVFARRFRTVAWMVTLCAFALFAGFSGWKLIQGSASCGCFGDVIIRPSHTLALNLGVLAALMVFPPPGIRTTPRSSCFRLVAVATCFAGASALMLATAGQGLQTVRISPGVESTGHILRLDPSKWIGKELPIKGLLLTPLDILEHGCCTIWIVDPACAKCHREFKEEVSDGSPLADCERLVIVVNARSGDITGPWNSKGVTLVELDSPSEVHCPVPVKLNCVNGHVLSAEFNARHLPQHPAARF